jgi:hypothetical protein
MGKDRDKWISAPEFASKGPVARCIARPTTHYDITENGPFQVAAFPRPGRRPEHSPPALEKDVRTLPRGPPSHNIPIVVIGPELTRGSRYAYG